MSSQIQGIVAAGNSQGTATPLPPSGQVIAFDVQVVPSGSGVRLPLYSRTTVNGLIRNSGANPLLIYPLPGGTINNSTNPYSLAVGSVIFIEAFSQVDWVVLPPTAGSTTTGIEIDQSFGTIVSQSASGGTVTLNLSNSNKFAITLTGSITLAFSGGNVGQSFSIAFTQGGSGGFTVTYSGSTFLWANKAQPTLTAAAGSIDLVAFVCPSAGTYWGGVAFPNIG